MKRYTAEKTTFISIGGNTVPVASFTPEIIQEFEVMDRMKQDAADATYRMEVLAHAIKSKTDEISQMINAFYAPKTSAPVVNADAAQNDSTSIKKE